MSVIVKGIDMPECCACCFAISDSLGWCKASGNDIYSPFSMDGRPSFCPLRPMPVKHGRLIDADEATRGSLERTGKRLLAIDTAPTIVEAEE